MAKKSEICSGREIFQLAAIEYPFVIKYPLSVCHRVGKLRKVCRARVRASDVVIINKATLFININFTTVCVFQNSN